MKKILAVFLALVMVLSFASCGKPKSEDGDSKIKMEVVTGVTVPEFKIKVCGAKVTNKDMESYSLYKVTSDTVNSTGTAHNNVYVGYKFSDVLEAAKVEGTLGKVKVVCTDGYECEFEGDLKADGVLLGITKDDASFKDGPWFAPCTSKTTGDFAQDLSKIEIEGGSSSLAGGKDEGNDGKDSGKETADIPFPQDPLAEDKTDKIKFGDFCFKVNGKEIKNADLDGLKVFRITVTTKNSKDVVSQSKYSGYVLKDVLAKLGVSGSSVTAVAADGYKNELTAEQIASDLTILAIEKDKEVGKDGTIWVAPCAENTSGAYAKEVVEIVVK